MEFMFGRIDGPGARRSTHPPRRRPYGIAQLRKRGDPIQLRA
jgi:hypothetical protein